MITYDSAFAYDTKFVTWDGVAVPSIKEMVYRELKFGILAGLVSEERIQLDMRLSPEPLGTASWVIFRRITQNRFEPGLIRERWEFEVIVPHAHDSTLRAIQTALIDGCSGTFRTWGRFEEDGSDRLCGIPIKCRHINTIERFNETLEEKSSLLVFALSYRG